MYDYDYLATLDGLYLVLMNCTLTDEAYNLLQRGIGKFYNAFESVVNEHKIDDYNDFCSIQGASATFDRFHLFDATQVVISSTSFAYNQIPRFEFGSLEYSTHTEDACTSHEETFDQSDESFIPWRRPIASIILKEQNTWLALHFPESASKKVKKKSNWRSPVLELKAKWHRQLHPP